MRKSDMTRFIVLITMLVTILIACRRGEETTPTAESTEVPAAATLVAATEEPATVEPTATAEPQPTPTAETVAAINPEDIDWPPQVIASNPVPGEEVDLDSPIAVRFDQPMNQESVEAAWAIEPAVDGSFQWPRNDTVIFTPDGELNRAQDYLVRVGADATSQNGLALEQAVEFNLQTVGNLEVNQVIPADNTQNVQGDGAITVVFNRPVVPLVSSDQQSSLPQPLTIDPPVEGAGTWVSTSIYRFEPGPAGFAGATNYQVTVDEGLADVTGAELPASYSWQFSTESPSVVQTLPADGSMLVPPTRAISITFSLPMDQASTEAAVSINAPTTFSYDWQENDTLLVMTPEEPLDLETSYAVQVGQSATSANGQAGLDQATSFAFTTLPFPAVKSTNPSDGSTTDTWQRGVGIEFASPMDLSTLEDQIIIDPAPDRVRYNYNQWIDELNPGNSNFNLYLDFNLDQNAHYSITVPGDAADIYGNILGEDYTFEFDTPGFEPLASFNLNNPLNQISTSFPSDVEVIHRNVTQFTVNLYDLGLPLDMLSQVYLNDALALPEVDRTWTIPVNTAEDEIGISTVSLADGGVLDPGIYFLTITAPGISSDVRYWQNQRVLLTVADSNLVVKEMPDEVHIWATDLETGEPVSGNTITLYDSAQEEIGTATTDSSGFAAFDYTSPEGYQQGVVAISNAPGEEGFGAASSFWSGGLNPWTMGLNYGYARPLPQFTYLYTDRPIYRPGDTVYYKGIVRNNDFGRYTLPEERTLNLTLSPQSYFQEGEGLNDIIVADINADGIFSGEYTLPEDMLLGTYAITLYDETMEVNRSFTVAEYRKPEFQVTLTPEVEETYRGESVDFALEATYFFGGSAANLDVNWTFYEAPFYPDVPGPQYSFGDQSDFYYVDPGIFGGVGGGGTFGNYISGGSGTTDENGNLTISVPADLLKDAEEGSRKVTVEATVQDITNFPVTAHNSVIMHSAEGYVGVRPADFMPLVGTEATVDLITVDWAGDPLPNQNVEVVFYRREWVSTRNSDYGIYYTEWEPEDTEVETVTVTTDDQGEAQASFIPEEGGSYIAVATLTDSAGRQQVSTTTLWVLDENYAGWRTDPKEKSMDLIPDKDEYTVGETARILVQSPFSEQINAWLTVERGNLLEQRVITLDGGSTVIDVPISAEFAPNAFVSVVAIKPTTDPAEDNPYADIRLGVLELTVPPDQFNLNVSLNPLETLYGPGDTAAYDVLITDNNGNPVAADFSLALVDLAVLTLKEDNAPPILEAFYSPQPYRSQVGSGLFISGEGLEPEIPLQGGGLGGGGGDGLQEAAIARLDEEDEARSEFPDTAYWEASVHTDADGHATVEIPLPDSLTTWRLSSKAVTTDTKVGQNAVDVVVSLPLLIRPVTPRFFTAGDVVYLGAVVNNNTESDLETTVQLETDGLTLSGETEQVVTVPAGGSQLVRWEAAVEDVPFADLTFRVEGGEYKDASKPPLGVGPDKLIPVYRYLAQDFTGTAGELDAEGQRVEAVLLPEAADPSRGSVDMQLNPSLAAALIDALNIVEKTEFDPACAHAITDRLLPNLATDQAIQQLNLDQADLGNQLAELIPEDVASLQGLQQRGGGWGWCSNPDSDPWLSAYALLALVRAEANGYDPSALAISRAQNYVEDQLYQMDDINFSWEANRQAFFLYVLAESGNDVSAQADELFAEHSGLLDPYAKAMLILAYEASGDQGANQQSLLSALNDDVVLSATGAHWEDAEQDFFNLNSDVRGTAMIFDALSLVEPDNALLPNAIRWLMSARTAQIWSTGHETAWSILGLANWMAASGELEADYSYAVDVNGVPRADGQFNAENITESSAFSVPVSSLLDEDTNFFAIQRGAGAGKLYYTMHLNSFINADSVEATSRGLTVERTYYDAACDPETETCEPITEIEAGQTVRVVLTIVAPNDLVYVVVEDPFPAGAEGIDPNLDISASGTGPEVNRTDSDFPFGYWGWWYFNSTEFKDEKVVFHSNFLPAGTYQYTYTLQTAIPGQFQVMPAVGYQEFFPEVFGRSDGMLFEITEE